MKLKLNGAQYDLNFGLGAFEIAEDRLDMSMDEILTNLQKSKVFNNFVYSALLNAIRIEDETALEPFGYNAFLSYVNELDLSVNEELTEAILKTTYYGKTFAERLGIDLNEEEEGEKKKEPVKKPRVRKLS
jgi:hypothetical protein